MYVVLTQDVPKLGNKNSLVKVADGFFRNYLDPKNLAVLATEKVLEGLKDQILEQKKLADQSAKAAAEVAQALGGVEITIVAKASDKGTLFQAITEAEVLEALKKQGVQVGADSLKMEALKQVGDASVTVVAAGKEISVPVKIVAEGSVVEEVVEESKEETEEASEESAE